MGAGGGQSAGLRLVGHRGRAGIIQHFTVEEGTGRNNELYVTALDDLKVTVEGTLMTFLRGNRSGV